MPEREDAADLCGRRRSRVIARTHAHERFVFQLHCLSDRRAGRRRHQALPRAGAPSTCGDSAVLASEGRLFRRGENGIDEMRSGRRSSDKSPTKAANSATGLRHHLALTQAAPSQRPLGRRHLSPNALDTAIPDGTLEPLPTAACRGSQGVWVRRHEPPVARTREVARDCCYKWVR